MNNLNEAFSKVGLDTLNQLNKAAELVLKSTEELFKLNLDFTKKSFADNKQTAEQVLKNTGNPQEAGKEAGEWANRKGEQLTQHFQALYAWADAVQQNTQKLAESQFAAAQASIKSQLEEMKKYNNGQEIEEVWFDVYNIFKQDEEWREKLKNTFFADSRP